MKEQYTKSTRNKVYACHVCRTCFQKDANEPTPICCGKAMDVLDELDESELSEEKANAGRPLNVSAAR